MRFSDDYTFIRAGSITADKLNVTELSAITTSTGSLNVTGDIVTTTGTIATGTSGNARVELADYGSTPIAKWWTEDADELAAGYIEAQIVAAGGSDSLRLSMYSGRTRTGDTAASLDLFSTNASGSVLTAAWITADDFIIFGKDGSGLLTYDAVGHRLMVPEVQVRDGDTDTYISGTAADRIAFITGGTERVRVNNNGLRIQSGNIEDSAGNKYLVATVTTPTPAIKGQATPLTIGAGGYAESVLIDDGVTVEWWCWFNLGGAGFGAGTGTYYYLDVPVTVKTTYRDEAAVGEITLYDTSGAVRSVGLVHLNGTRTQLWGRVHAQANPWRPGGPPFALGQNDLITLHVRYARG